MLEFVKTVLFVAEFCEGRLGERGGSDWARPSRPIRPPESEEERAEKVFETSMKPAGRTGSELAVVVLVGINVVRNFFALFPARGDDFLGLPSFFLAGGRIIAAAAIAARLKDSIRGAGAS